MDTSINLIANLSHPALLIVLAIVAFSLLGYTVYQFCKETSAYIKEREEFQQRMTEIRNSKALY